MAFAGNCGLDVDLGRHQQEDEIASLFSEELGLVIEYLPSKEAKIISILYKAALPYQVIGTTTADKTDQHHPEQQTPVLSRRHARAP